MSSGLEIGGNTTLIRQSLQSLFRNVAKSEEWAAALKDVVSAFMTESTQRVLFDEIARAATTTNSVDGFVEALSVLLDFDFGDEPQFQKVLKDLVDAIPRCSRVAQVDTILRVIERIMVQDSASAEFVLHEAPRRWDQICRPDKEKDLDLYAACCLLKIFASSARNQLASAVSVSLKTLSDLFPPLMSHQSDTVASAALNLLRAITQQQLVNIDDEVIESYGFQENVSEGRLAFVCEVLASTEAEAPQWITDSLDRPHSAPTVRSLLYCIESGYTDEHQAAATLLAYARKLDGSPLAVQVILTLPKVITEYGAEATQAATLSVAFLGKAELDLNDLESIGPAVRQLLPLADAGVVASELATLLNSLGTKRVLPAVHVVVELLVAIDPVAADAYVERVLAWARTVFKTPKTKQHGAAVRAVAALAACPSPLIFPAAADIAALMADTDNPELRIECIKSCIALCAEHVRRDVENNRLNSAVLALLGQLLDAAVGDANPNVRAAVLRELEGHAVLDGHLVLSDPLECLIMAIHDAESTVSLLAMQVCCRIAPRNPSIIGPGLSRVEGRLVRDAQGKVLGLSTSAVQKLHIMAMADRLTTSQIVLETLCVEKLVAKSSSFTLQCHVFAFLATIAERAKLTDRHMDSEILVKRSLEAIRNPLCAPRRRAAANTLAAVLRYVNKNVGLDVFREIVDIMVAGRNDMDLLNELAQVVGVIGGVHQARSLLFDNVPAVTVPLANITQSPYLQPATPTVNHSEDHGAGGVELESLRPASRSHPKLQFQNASVALYTLAKCLKGAPHQQRSLVQCMGELIDVVGPQQRQQLVPHLVPTLLQWLSEPLKGHLHGHILAQLRSLWEQRDTFTKPMRTTMLQVLESCGRGMEYQRAAAENFVVLLIQIARGSPDDIRGHAWIASFAMQKLVENRDNRLALLCVELLEATIFILDKDLHHALAQVLYCAQSSNVDVQIRCVSFLTTVVHSQAVKDCCARIVHAILDVVVASANKNVQQRGIEFLCILVSSVGNSAVRFIKVIEGTMTRKGIESEQFAKAMAAFNQTGAFPTSEERREASAVTSVSNANDTMFVVTSRAELSNQQVKLILAEALSIPTNTINVISNQTAGGSTVVKFRFENLSADVTHHFINLVNHEDVALRKLEVTNLSTERLSAVEGGPQRDFTRALVKIRGWKRIGRQASTQEWISWLTNVALELVHCSEPALRTLSEVVKSNEMLAREIFPFAFVWVFSKLDTDRKKEVVASLSGAIERCSPEVRQILFGLAEFMESERAEQVITRAYTQHQRCVVERPSLEEKFGIHYEGEGNNITVVKVAEGGPGHRAKVPLNYTLRKIDGVEITAVSQIVAHIKYKLVTVLELAKEDQRRYVSSRHRPFFDLERLAGVAYNAHLFAKALHYYELVYEESIVTLPDADARQTMLRAATALTNLYNVTGNTHEFSGLQRYTAALVGDEHAKAVSGRAFTKTDVAMGSVRQAEAQGRFEEIVAAYEIVKSSPDSEVKNSTLLQELAASTANSALALSRWDVLQRALTDMRVGPERAFLQGVASVARSDPADVSKALLSSCRRALSVKFTSEIAESYSTAYDSLMQLQHLSHLKEVTIYRQASETVKQRLHDLWSRRLASMSRSPQHWTVTLAVNSLVIAPGEDLDARLTYASICREVSWNSQAERILAGLLGVESLRTNDAKLYNESTKPRVALALFKEKYHSKQQTEAIIEFEDYMQLASDRFLEDPSWARCHLLLGEWLMNSGEAEKALSCVRKATEVDASNVAGWHAWGMLAYRQASQIWDDDPDAAMALIVSTIEGLFRAVELGEDRLGTQDVLRIMSIWFDFGHKNKVLRAVISGAERCPSTAWLRVVPQLIARLGTCHRDIRASVTQLVQKIAEQFPHALIYPLTVSEKGGRDPYRKAAARSILNAIREAHPALVDQASLISDELVRIAILWAEKWTEQLTRTSRLPERQDCKAVLESISHLFDELETPLTGDEKLFESHYGQTLRRAKSALLTDATAAQAWNFFQQVYSKINRPARQLVLSSVSPKLAELKNSVVPVPGLGSRASTVTISQFLNDVTVIPSKHKPRRFGIKGSDGVEYRFLLKGHEDLRQDERVMQLFDLINTLFRTDPSCNSLGLRVVRYTAVPLSDNVGILSWLDDSETFFKLIEARRSATGVVMHEECNLIVKKGRLKDISEYQTLPKSVRRDLLQFAIDSTPSDEMRRIQWDANDTCEEWLSYRSVYGRTLAVMSMVGYLLGLGDRHLNNLMIQKSGAVVHIDFGDCFEVAMHRDQYPERVPFRLTRLLVRALGVMEVEGTFRLTCEVVVKQLRKFRDSLLSVLETFVDDPLVSWRGRAKQQPTEKLLDESLTEPTPADYEAFADGIAQCLADAGLKDLSAADSVDERCSVAARKPHDVAINTARTAIIAEMNDRGTAAAIKAFMSYLPVLSRDIRVCAPTGELAPRAEFLQFFTHGLETYHRDFGDRALNRIKSKLNGTDFAPDIALQSGSQSPNSAAARSQRTLAMGDAQAAFAVDPNFFIRDSVFGESIEVDSRSLRSIDDLAAMDRVAENSLTVVEQVNRLILEARSMDNLADAYLTGWAPFL
jgi:FKBP12-rapamycin complex-associated protein